jgi:2-dehydro-3-deoxygluconokinase
MIELREEADGRLFRSFGGDTLNTAVYLARLGTPVDYITALGDDSWSDELIAAWKARVLARAGSCDCPGACPASTLSRRI